MKHLIEATALYKMGHQRFTEKIAILARTIDSIRPVPEEIPEHMDGAKSMIVQMGGHALYVLDKYPDLIDRWDAALGD